MGDGLVKEEEGIEMLMNTSWRREGGVCQTAIAPLY